MNKKDELGGLDARSSEILRGLVREYIHSGRPVGSRRLAKAHSEKLSPATIRSVMANLEERGFLKQPHTSAGRVPTDKGYRVYVDSLLETRKLSKKEVNRIKGSLEQETDPADLMTKTSQILSTFSDNVGFVLAPPISLAVLKHIEFVKTSRERVLVILVTGAGLVQHRFIQLDEAVAQSDLDQAGRYLGTHFQGKTLLEIRDELLRLMSEEKSLYDRILKNVILLGSAALMNPESDVEEGADVYLGGAAQIIQKPEMNDINRMIALFETFEEKSRLVKIISECLKSNPEGLTVTIGLEEHIPRMRDWALVTSPYLHNHKVMGGLGILGPSRMEYARAISLVDYVAKLFGELLDGN